MASGKRLTLADSGGWFVSSLGGVFVVIEASRASYSVAEGGSVAGALVGLLLIGTPGAVLLYGGYRFPDTELDPTMYHGSPAGRSAASA